MRFKGTWILLLVCLALGCFIYFYEIKGGEEREKAKEAEKRFWMLESKDIEQLELLPPGETFSPPGERIVAVRKNKDEWGIQVPRPLEADSGELNRLAESAAEIKFESILEETATDTAKFGLSPARFGFRIKTGNAEEYEILFGDKNPTEDRIYARVPNRDKIYLVSTSTSETFDKKLDDLRNHSVLQFEQSEVRTLKIKNKKGSVDLVKDDDDRWWIEGKDRVAADSPAIRGILNALSLGRIPEFFDEDPKDYTNATLDKPIIDVSLTYGKDKALKRLNIGATKARLRKKGKSKPAEEGSSDATPLYLAKDASRPELFFVNEDLVEKLSKSLKELRDKSIAAFQRWDVDSIVLENPDGRFSFVKEGGEWFLGDDRKKTDFDNVYGILDAIDSAAIELIDNPGKATTYGLDDPAVRVLLKQGNEVLAECSMGKTTENGTYAQTRGDSAVKVMDPENYEKLLKDESDFIEPETTPESDDTSQEQ